MKRYSMRPRIRIVDDEGLIAIGPGKADLLHAIAESGSIRAGAGQLGMSYMRAWNLVRTMNTAFRSPLVEKIRGGPRHGGARLTERGEAVLGLYRRMEKKAAAAMAPEWRRLRRQLRQD